MVAAQLPKVAVGLPLKTKDILMSVLLLSWDVIVFFAERLCRSAGCGRSFSTGQKVKEWPKDGQRVYKCLANYHIENL
jgi:hypothetical protein